MATDARTIRRGRQIAKLILLLASACSRAPQSDPGDVQVVNAAEAAHPARVTRRHATPLAAPTARQTPTVRPARPFVDPPLPPELREDASGLRPLPPRPPVAAFRLEPTTATDQTVQPDPPHAGS